MTDWSDEVKARLELMADDPAHFDHTEEDTQAIRAALGEIERQARNATYWRTEHDLQQQAGWSHLQRAEAAEASFALLDQAASDYRKMLDKAEAEVERLREALEHQRYRNHKFSEACDGCRALLAPEVK